MMHATSWKLCKVVLTWFILGLLTSGLVFPAFTPIGSTYRVEASAPHQSLRYIYCNTVNGSISDHYDLWTDNVNWGSSSTASWNIAMQVHYRINNDCSFKGYFVNAQNQGGGCGSPCYNPYIVSPALYNGYNFIFDSAPMGCLNIGSATGYFSQYSNSSAVIYMSTEWYPRSGCSGYPLTWLSHYFTYQP